MTVDELKTAYYDLEADILSFLSSGSEFFVIEDLVGIPRGSFDILIEHDEDIARDVKKHVALFEVELQKRRKALLNEGSATSFKAAMDETNKAKIRKLEEAHQKEIDKLKAEIVDLKEQLERKPPLIVEFKRGDMRTCDEITVTNTETFEKKSLASLRS